MEIQNNRIFSDNELPKTWDEFCDKYPVTDNEAVLSHNSVILTFDDFPNTVTERIQMLIVIFAHL